MIYAVAIGHDVALEDLEPLVQQPKSVGRRYSRRTYSASGAVTDENPYYEYVWEMFPDIETYQAQLDQFGLLGIDNRTSEVSFSYYDEDFNEAIANGTAIKPLIGENGQQENGFLVNFVILVRDIRAQA